MVAPFLEAKLENSDGQILVLNLVALSEKTLSREEKDIRQYLRACFPTVSCLPTACYFGWHLGGVTFNLRLSGQFVCAVPKMRAVG